jgi:hypothetical protein
MRRTIARAMALAALAAGAACAQLTVTCLPATLPQVVGTAVSVACTASGGTGGPYTWGLKKGGALPPGLTQNADGSITGTLVDPPGTYSFTVVAEDSAQNFGIQAYSGTTVDPVTVGCTSALGPSEVGVAYSDSCTASNGTPPYTWTISGPTVPPGLTVTPTANPATVSDTPASPLLAYSYSVVATDSSVPPSTNSQAFTGAIGPAITTVSPLPAAVVGSLYSQQFAAVDGVTPYGWTAANLPSWLTMSTTGLLKGTPTSPGSVSFMVTVMDSAGGSSSGSFSLTVTPALTITTTSPLLPATIGEPYTATFGATGGSGTGYTWSVSGQPSWLTMTSSTGVLAGTPPSTAVTSTFTVKVTDSNNNSTSGSFTLPVTLAITTTSPLPPATIGTLYSQTLGAVGGAGGYTWSVTTGSSLPSWLTLTGATLKGTPPATATNASFSLTVTDSNNTSVSAPFTLPVTLAIATTTPLTTATIGSAYSQTFAAEGGAGGYTWSATGLPAWLALSTAGVLTSTTVPTTALDATFTVKVTDSAKGTVSGQFTVPVTLSITTGATLPAALVNTPYSETFAAQGGSGVYAWTATGLPSWATLSAGGLLSGQPTTAGQVSFPVTVTDSLNATQTLTFTLTVNLPPLTITTSGLANGTVGVSYFQTLTGTGGMPPYTWSLTTGSLPTGLTLGASGAQAGIISGTPSKAGTFPFTVQLSDSAAPTPNTTTKPFTITIGTGLTITTPSPLPNATVGIAYSQTLAAAGGVPPYTWSPAGALPAPFTALSLSAGGAIAGTPAATGTGTFPVTVADSTGATAKQTFALAIVAPPAIDTTSLPNGTAGVNYSQTLAASGGTPPYQWAIASGSLPAALSLSPTGSISGIPSAAGTSTFTVQLTDATGVTAKQALTLTIVTNLRISTASPLPSGEVSVAYSQTLTATGGTSPYTWSVIAGALPQGVTLAAGGSLSGTPSAAGAFSFTVQVTDSNHVTASTAFALTIAGALSISTPAALNGGSLNSSYSQTLLAANGAPPYSWTLTTGTLPPGLNLSTVGIVAGVPTATGTFPFTAKVTDTLGATASRQFTIVIATGLTISTPPTLPGATVGIPYSELLQAAGGTAPYTWTNPSGSLPAGLALQSTGNVNGVPTVAGSSTFTVMVTDSVGLHASTQLSITVAPALSITTSALHGGTVGAVYSQSLAATGGTPPYTWSVLHGSLPGGLALSTAGSITGTASAAGTFSFTVLVTDSTAATASKQLSITVASGLSITTAATLPNASLNVSYSQALGAAGGTPPYTWTLTAGSLPKGLALSAAGAITGAPTAGGTFTFTATVTDSASGTASQQFTLFVAGGLAITTTTLPGGTVGVSYSQTLSAAGGTPPYTFATSAGSLPPGITLSGAVLGGTPTKSGSYTFTIQATDSVSATATQQFTIAITGLAITMSALPSAAVGTAYSQTLTATGTAPYTWAIVQGGLPGGLSLGASSGTISGTPTAAGTSSLTIQVTDSTNATASAAFTLTVISASYSGLSSTAASATQSSFTLALGAAYPADITGQVTLAFQPDSSLASPADDPSIQFSTGGTSASFTIPANSTAPVSFALQTGTVAGTITLTVSWQAGGATLPSPAALTQTIQIAPAVPVITAVSATTTSSGFQVTVTGYSNTREASQAVLQFTPASGQTLQTTSVTVSLTSAATSWFQSSASDQYGSQFILTLPFTVSNGSASAIGSVSVQLVNSQGSSTSASATL